MVKLSDDGVVQPYWRSPAGAFAADTWYHLMLVFDANESGNDKLRGGAGYDTLEGGEGSDNCSVGADGGTISNC